MKPSIRCYTRRYAMAWFARCGDGRYVGIGAGVSMIEAAQSAYKAFMAVPRHE